MYPPDSTLDGDPDVDEAVTDPDILKITIPDPPAPALAPLPPPPPPPPVFSVPLPPTAAAPSAAHDAGRLTFSPPYRFGAKEKKSQAKLCLGTRPS